MLEVSFSLGIYPIKGFSRFEISSPNIVTEFQIRLAGGPFVPFRNLRCNFENLTIILIDSDHS